MCIIYFKSSLSILIGTLGIPPFIGHLNTAALVARLDHPPQICKKKFGFVFVLEYVGLFLDCLLPLVLVHLFLVLPALGLAVWAVPVEQDREGDDEERVRHRDRRHD